MYNKTRFKLVAKLQKSPTIYRSMIGAEILLSGLLLLQGSSNILVARITGGPAPHNAVIVSYLLLSAGLGYLYKDAIKGFVLTWAVVGFYELSLLVYWNLTQYPVYDIGVQQVIIYSSYLVALALSLRWWKTTRIPFIMLGLVMLTILAGLIPVAAGISYHSTLYPGSSPTNSPYFLNAVDNAIEIANVIFACSVFLLYNSISVKAHEATQESHLS